MIILVIVSPSFSMRADPTHSFRMTSDCDVMLFHMYVYDGCIGTFKMFDMSRAHANDGLTLNGFFSIDKTISGSSCSDAASESMLMSPRAFSTSRTHHSSQ